MSVSVSIGDAIKRIQIQIKRELTSEEESKIIAFFQRIRNNNCRARFIIAIIEAWRQRETSDCLERPIERALSEIIDCVVSANLYCLFELRSFGAYRNLFKRANKIQELLDKKIELTQLLKIFLKHGSLSDAHIAAKIHSGEVEN